MALGGIFIQYFTRSVYRFAHQCGYPGTINVSPDYYSRRNDVGCFLPGIGIMVPYYALPWREFFAMVHAGSGNASFLLHHLVPCRVCGPYYQVIVHTGDPFDRLRWPEQPTEECALGGIFNDASRAVYKSRQNPAADGSCGHQPLYDGFVGDLCR